MYRCLSSQLISHLPQIQRLSMNFLLNNPTVPNQGHRVTVNRKPLSPFTPISTNNSKCNILQTHTHTFSHGLHEQLLWRPNKICMQMGGTWRMSPFCFASCPTSTELGEDRASVFCGVQEGLDVSLNRKWTETTWQFATLKHVNFFPRSLLGPSSMACLPRDLVWKPASLSRVYGRFRSETPSPQARWEHPKLNLGNTVIFFLTEAHVGQLELIYTVLTNKMRMQKKRGFSR